MKSPLAKEHILCSLCFKSANGSRLLPTLTKGSELFRSYSSYKDIFISASAGCHLCSLFLGTFKPGVQTGDLRSVEVRLRVSRTGGAWLAVVALPQGPCITSQVDSDLIPPDQLREQVMGELPVFRTLEGRFEDPQPGSPFAFVDPSIYKNAQLSKSLSYDASASLAKEWLCQCLQHHDKCTLAAEGVSPTYGYPARLIRVGGGGDNEFARLVVTVDLVVMPRYLTLSHCWGGADILKLLLGNFNDLKNGIPFSNLPSTFQDAIVITRQLGFQYVWIDSLCIIQDLASDWRSESAIMGEIYAHSVCTIAALTARSSFEGCFSGARSNSVDHEAAKKERTPLAFRVCKIPHGLHAEYSASLDVELRVDHSPLPLHTRAWVVQERLLAPRTLYYGAWGLAWECVACSATESYPFGKHSQFSPKASFFEICNRAQAADLTSESRDALIYSLWRDVQASYTRCHLTFFTDRLIAISSVVKRIEQLTGWTNMWGLWKEKLLYELVWFVDDPKDRPEVKEYLAPTWSWAGVRGLVFFDTVGDEVPIWSAEVMETGTKDERGFIRLRAAMKEVVRTSEIRRDLVDKTRSRAMVVSWFPDTLAARRSTEEMRCVLLLRIPNRWDKYAVDLGLVISGSGDEVVRLGSFMQLRSDTCPLFEEDIRDEDVDEIIIY
ncbi:HET-domain-containing protein [Coniophora puteana RWD-64-598 SS2]|uniref:HET-domain-containing protein n=1 Tax=Coniophora puteana (strain RWD-64-598) TaxID=741705 RepID=A0A5M3MTS1_CONPW|nr:HET-domain-containing protein [Coniophora puteana RWD-64-598 SS2]EIW82553.1 HET-domain-containing protein [Coniophora puteana RWD-64-598 SS2]